MLKVLSKCIEMMPMDIFLYSKMHSQKVPKEKKLILDNLNDLKNFYKPKLMGIKTIGLTCAQRRIKDNEWENYA